MLASSASDTGIGGFSRAGPLVSGEQVVAKECVYPCGVRGGPSHREMRRDYGFRLLANSLPAQDEVETGRRQSYFGL